MNMSPYLYAIIVYFVLMFLSKVAYTYFVELKKTEKTEKTVRLNWNFNLVKLRHALMSVWF